MPKLKKLVVGNWKMNPETVAEAKKIAGDVKRAMKNVKKTHVVICPPFVHLASLSTIADKTLFLGAQNTHHEEKGSFTGEISFTQLKQLGVSHVIVGHSERRKMGETDETINRKARSVVGENMIAIICVGESLRDTHGEYFSFVKEQILSALKDIPRKLLSNVIVAYEPLWAIGAKEAMSPNDLHEMSIFIKKVLKDAFAIAGESVQVIYGGSVDRANADRLIRDGNVNGLLVGRESLKPKDFVEIIKLVDSI